MKYKQWNIGTPDPEAVSRLSRAGIPRLLAIVLASRGIVERDAVRAALSRERRLTLSPLLMKDMDRAVERVRRAIANRETVAVFGDYDVDGITSTVLLTDYLRRQGLHCLRYIPRRIEDGYGLSKEAVRTLQERGVTLLITVDCGITGGAEIAYAASLGMDVVVTDHHECKDDIPDAVAVVDPHRPGCPYPFKHLAGVGVALKLVLALGEPREQDALFHRYSALAAIGTVADVMRMEGENRIIVTVGLETLPHTDFVGLLALLRETGLEGKPLTSTQVGFVLSPRINAAGRMGKADLAADLLETRDPARAEELARALCDLNRERQAVEQAISADAVARIETMPPEERHALVLSSEEWHQGVVGIVASRLSERYACPSFMIHLKGNIGKGSCRSCGGFNLFEALERCSDLLEGFGGHALAAGFTISKENIDAFRTRMNACVREAFGKHPPAAALDIDAALMNPAEITLEQAARLERLEPYGAGNPRPVFAMLGATVESMQTVGQGRHLKLRLARGASRFDAIFFSVTEETCGVRVGDRVDAAFSLQENVFRGTTTLQLQMIDIRPSLQPSRHEAEALDLVQRLMSGEAVTAQERLRLSASRDQYADCWRALRRILRNADAEAEKAVRAETTVAQSPAAQSTAVQSTAAQSPAAQSTAEQSAAAQSTAERSTAGQSTAGQDTAAQSTVAQSTAAQAGGSGTAEVEALPCLRTLASQMGGCEGFLRSALALEVFRERGLLNLEQRGDMLELSMIPREGKADLFACPYLQRIRNER